MLQIYLFGPLRLALDGKGLSFSGLPKVGPLFVHLLLNHKLPISRDSLAFLLWPDASEVEARANLRRHLYELRHLLPPSPPDQPWIIATNSTVQWNPAGATWVDILEFQRLIAQKAFREAIILYEGDFLSDLYEDWIIAERERLRELYFTALSQLIKLARQEGDHKQAMSYARHILTLDPLREDVAREMVALRYEIGDRPGAIQEYQRFVHLLKEELDVSPMPETVALFQLVNQNLPLPGRNSPAPPTPPTPLSPPDNLPTPLTSFIGRQSEIASLIELIDNGTRLITLTGPGGTGKTRLTIETASQLRQSRPEQFPDGFFFVGLSTITNPALVLSTIGNVLGVRDTGRESSPKIIADFLRHKKLLLILDNFEQLLPAAPLISELLSNAPTLCALVTSRTTLELYGEQEFAVPPLSTEKLERLIRDGQNSPANLTDLSHNPAIALFVARAKTAIPTFQLTNDNGLAIAEICTRLDGLPLAIELAAARSKLFSPSAMLAQFKNSLSFLSQRARNLPVRQQTLRDTIAWSYDLLEAEEKQLLAALSVFRGPFSLEAAQVVLGTESWQLTDRLESLVDKSMLRQLTPAGDDQPYFRMLFTIREFAQEQLPHYYPDQNYLQAKHASYYQQLADRAFFAARSHEHRKWNDQLLVADDNIRTAMEWALGHPTNPEALNSGAMLCASLDNFWQIHGRLNEGRGWQERFIPFCQQLSPPTAVRLLNTSGWFSQLQGEYELAKMRHSQALEIARELNQLPLIATTLILLGTHAGRTGNYVEAEKLLSEALSFRPRIADSPGMIFYSWPALLNNLAIVTKYLGQYERAISLLEETYHLQEAAGNKQGMAGALANMGNIAILQQNFTNAVALYQRSVALRRQLNDQTGLINALSGLGHLAIAQGNCELGIKLYGAFQIISQTLNISIPPAARPTYEKNLALAQATLGESAFAIAWGAGATLTLEEALTLATQFS